MAAATEERQRLPSEYIQFEKLTEKDQALLVAQRNNAHQALAHTKFKAAEPGYRERWGIVDFTTGCSPGEPRQFHWHQVHAMFHLKKSCDISNKSKNWYERKKAMVFLHAMGSGKTVTAGVGCLALIRHTMPDCGEFKVLIIVPLTVLHAWYDTLMLWLKRVRVGIFQKQEDLTMETIENTDIIIITHDLVYFAAKEFMWKDEEAKECGTKADGSPRYTHEFKRGHDPTSKRGIAWQKKHGSQFPPMHPLFEYKQMIDKGQRPRFSAIIADEPQLYLKHDTWRGHFIAVLNQSAVHTIGLTGTPSPARLKQMPQLFKLLNAEDEEIKKAAAWSVRGSPHAINFHQITKAHRDFIHRVSELSLGLPEKRMVTLDFDPFVGHEDAFDSRVSAQDQLTQAKVIYRHNTYLEKVRDEALEVRGAYRKELDSRITSALRTMNQMAFNKVLGMYGAKDLHEQEKLMTYAIKCPSQYMVLIHRMLRDRQQKGHPRIIVHSVSSAMLKILKGYLDRKGDIGKTYMFVGSMQAHERSKVIEDFKSPAVTRRGVLLMSEAGSTGLNISRGCDTVFVVGEMPWSPSQMDQAFHRVRRIDQPNPCEFVVFKPRRSIAALMLKMHEDKELRLAAAVNDRNYENFEGDSTTWKIHMAVAEAMAGLNASGNYGDTGLMATERDRHAERVAVANATNQPAPPEPESLHIPTAQYARDIELPAVSFPIEGFVEPPLEDPVAPAPAAAASRAAGKRRVPPASVDSDSDDGLMPTRRAKTTDSGAGASTEPAVPLFERIARLRTLMGLEGVEFD